jgi:hypothetical protein
MHTLHQKDSPWAVIDKIYTGMILVTPFLCDVGSHLPVIYVEGNSLSKPPMTF